MVSQHTENDAGETPAQDKMTNTNKNMVPPHSEYLTDPSYVKGWVCDQDWLPLLENTPEYRILVEAFDEVSPEALCALGECIRGGTLAESAMMAMTSYLFCGCFDDAYEAVCFAGMCAPLSKEVQQDLRSYRTETEPRLQAAKEDDKLLSETGRAALESQYQAVCKALEENRDVALSEGPSALESHTGDKRWLLFPAWVKCGLPIELFRQDNSLRSHVSVTLTKSRAACFFLDELGVHPEIIGGLPTDACLNVWYGITMDALFASQAIDEYHDRVEMMEFCGFAPPLYNTRMDEKEADDDSA